MDLSSARRRTKDIFMCSKFVDRIKFKEKTETKKADRNMEEKSEEE
jgi:hypothetical protein